eukprot:g3348.t1
MAKAKHVVILGGGLSGLSACYFLARAVSLGLKESNAKTRLRITLLESSPRFGGWVESLDSKGFLFERGPRESAIKTSSQAKNRFIWANGEMIPLPSSPMGLLKRPDIGDENTPVLREFATRTKFTDTFCKALQVSFDGGMEMLPNAMVSELRESRSHLDVSLRSNATVLKVSHPSESTSSNSSMHVSYRTLSGDVEDLDADFVLSALPAGPLEKVLPRETWADASNAIGELARITKPVDVGVVNMGWHNSDRAVDNIRLPYDGFGFLVPSCEYDELLGVTWDSLVFPQQERTRGDKSVRVTAMLGGAHHPHIGSMSSSDLEKLAFDYVLTRHSIANEPDVTIVS